MLDNTFIGVSALCLKFCVKISYELFKAILFSVDIQTDEWMDEQTMVYQNTIHPLLNCTTFEFFLILNSFNTIGKSIIHRMKDGEICFQSLNIMQKTS